MIGRKLSSGERMIWCADRRAPLNFLLSVRLAEPLPFDLLAAAMAIVTSDFPLAGMSVSEGVDGPTFVQALNPPKLIDVGEVSWLELAQGELNRVFDCPNESLVRAVRVLDQGNYLLLVFHHSFGDGTSGVQLLSHLLEVCSLLRRGESVVSLPVGLADPLESRTLLDHEPSVEASLDGCRLEDEVVSPAERRTVMVPQLLSQEETLTFVKRAHERGVSVHGLLTACQLQAVGAEFDGAVKLSLSSPYNLRPRLVPPVGRGAGLFIGDARNCYLVDAKTGPWKLAAQISEDVARGARFGGAMGDGGSGDEVDLEGIYTNRVSTAMSNLGRIQFDQRTDCLHVERMFFAVGCSVLGDQIGAVVTTNGRLSWTFCAMTPTLSPHRIQRVAESMLARIRELL